MILSRGSAVVAGPLLCVVGVVVGLCWAGGGCPIPLCCGHDPRLSRTVPPKWAVVRQ